MESSSEVEEKMNLSARFEDETLSHRAMDNGVKEKFTRFVGIN
jgi:hypothetical protein